MNKSTFSKLRHQKVTTGFFCFLILLFMAGTGKLFIYNRQRDQELVLLLERLSTVEKEYSLLKNDYETLNDSHSHLVSQLDQVNSLVHTLESELCSNVYARLSKGLPVNILIVGDSIGAGSGCSRQENSWVSLITAYLEEKYNTKIYINNVSMGGCDSLCGYVRVKELDDNIDYDLVIVCYGQNDSPEQFDIFYESIIRAVCRKYTKCSIISIQESSQKTYTEKMKTISTIASYYGIPVVDTIAPFRKGNTNQEMDDFYNMLTADGIHPNDAGHAVYARQIENTIDKMVSSNADTEIILPPPLNKTVFCLDHFLWYGKEAFIRNGNSFNITLDRSITGSNANDLLADSDGALMIMDQYDIPGSNSFHVTNNGREVIATTRDWPHEFSQRHIFPVSAGCVLEPGRLTLHFETEEQADGFNGIGFITDPPPQHGE